MLSPQYVISDTQSELLVYSDMVTSVLLHNVFNDAGS